MILKTKITSLVLVFILNLVSAQEQVNTQKEQTLAVLVKPYQLTATQKNELSAVISEEIKKTQEVQQRDFLASETYLKQQDFLKAKAQTRYLETLSSFDLSGPIYLNNDQKQKRLIEQWKKTKIEQSKINEIIKLHVEHELKLKEFELTILSFMTYADENLYTYNSKSIHKDFAKKISQVISISEYEALFKSSLLPIIERTSEKILKKFASNYDVKEDKHWESLKSIADTYAKEKIIARHYYAYDKDKVHNTVLNTTFKETASFKKAIDGFNLKTNGIDTSFDARVPFFVTRARKAGISEENIKKLVYALKEKFRKVHKYHEDFAKYDKKYVIYFHDNTTGPSAHRKEFRKRVSEIMTLDQFESVFLDQFSERINREAKIRIAKLKLTYRNLNRAQLKTLSDMIADQVKQERVMYEYYGYDHNNAMQKLRAAKYKFSKKYKEKLKEVLVQ